MKHILFCLIFVSLLTGCNKSPQPNRYEEIVYLPTQTPPADLRMDAEQDPHQLLKKMIERGKDPHAFLGDPAQIPSMPATGQLTNDPQLNQQLLASKTQAPVIWTMPAEWTEAPAGAMRLASFKSSQFSSLDISIVALSGPAGGIFANVNRWRGQVQLAPLSETDFSQFIEKQEKTKTLEGLPIVFVDLTDAKAAGIYAAIIELNNQTVFIKMSGEVKEVKENIPVFKQFCLSLKPKN